MATASQNIVDAIVKANYAANPAQVELLASAVVLGDAADLTYLRVLIAHMQAALGRVRRGKQPPQEPVLDAVHEDLYPHALKGVGPDDMDQTERHRKATRFRSNASTIRYFVRNGGDVRGLDITTVTKSGLLHKAITGQTEHHGEMTVTFDEAVNIVKYKPVRRFAIRFEALTPVKDTPDYGMRVFSTVWVSRKAAMELIQHAYGWCKDRTMVKMSLHGDSLFIG